MSITEALTNIKYVVNASGAKTEVVLPIETWQQLIQLVEDQEDSALLREWLERRAAGKVEMVSLDELERELIADGLIQG